MTVYVDDMQRQVGRLLAITEARETKRKQPKVRCGCVGRACQNPPSRSGFRRATAGRLSPCRGAPIRIIGESIGDIQHDRRLHHAPAARHGGLAGSLTFHISNGAMEWGSDKVYAAIQQFGGVIVPKNSRALAFRLGGNLVRAKKVTIPARPYLGFGRDDQGTIEDGVSGFFARAMRG